MEILYFTAVAVLLYVTADFILDRIERYRGRRFEQRSLVFFSLLLPLALAVFALMRQLLRPD